jgi:NADH-quinone oxidoreductase subunit M
MSTYAVIRLVVLLLVLLPLVSAVLVPAFGRAARRVALILALIHLGLTAAVATMGVAYLNERAEGTARQRGDGRVQRFHPQFVPGDPGARGGSEGADARTGWTLFRLSAAEAAPGRPGPNVQLFLGIDGLNLWLVVLASVMMVPVILISWESIRERPGAFYGWLFLLQGGLVGTFLSFDVILFYVFFELTLIPAFFLIGRWGLASGRRDAARKFFLYTLAGSLLTLLGVIGVVLNNPTPIHPRTGTRMSEAIGLSNLTGPQVPEVVVAKRGPVTFSLPDLMGNVQAWAGAEATAQKYLENAQNLHAFIYSLPNAPAESRATADRHLESAKRALAEAEQIRAANVRVQFWLFIALMAGFMVKVPVWPFHTWLPAAYGEAPTGVVMMLSAVMAKLGTFGILRLVLPLVPDAAITYGLPVVGALAAFGIVYAALCAYASKDMKLLVAYSSVSHLGFVVLALFAFNQEGLAGAVLHMINHGLATGALFATLGFFLDRYRTTEMSRYGGVMGRFPNFAVLAFVICLASVGLPGLNNFVSEMMMLAGLFDADNPGVGGLWPGVVAVVGIFLSAWYTLTMMRRVFFGPPKEPEPVAPEVTHDVTRREFFSFGTLAVLCLALGLWPQPVIDTMKGDVRTIANIGDAARARARGVPYVSKEPREPEPLNGMAPGGPGGPPGPRGPQGPPPGGKKGGKGPVAE